LKEEFAGLLKYLKDTLKDKIEKAALSNHLATSPCALVAGKFGWTATMERIARLAVANKFKIKYYSKGTSTF
jgi:heat shock protein beta